MSRAGRRISHHGIGSRFRKKRADLVHQPLDPIIVAAPWIAGGGLAYIGVKSLLKGVVNIGRGSRPSMGA